MLSLLTLFLIITLSVSQQFPEDQGVLVLTDQTLHQALQKYEFLVIDFYAHWCGHCIQLAPIYAAAARQVRSGNLQFAKINCAEYQQICRNFGVQAFPTLKLFENGAYLYDIENERTEKGIVDWVRKKTNKGSVEAKSLDQIKRLAESNFCMVFFGASQESQEFKEYIQFSRKHKNINAIHTFNQNYANQMKAEVPSLVVFKAYDERKVALSDDFSYNGIERFIKKNQFPILMNFDINTAKRIFDGDQKTVFLIQSTSQNTVEKYIRLALSKIKDNVLVCLADTDHRHGFRLMQYFGIEPDYLPQVVAFDPVTEKFNLLSEINKDNIINFVNNFIGSNNRIDL